MDKEEFMRKALDAFEENVKNLRGCFKKQLNLAWEEGAKQGEHDKINSLADKLLKALTKNEEKRSAIRTTDITTDKTIEIPPYPDPDAYLPDYDVPLVCQNCSNHPSNGGSGICHCTLGGHQIKC